MACSKMSKRLNVHQIVVGTVLKTPLADPYREYMSRAVITLRYELLVVDVSEIVISDLAIRLAL